ncbi:MAG: glycosyltransferase [Rudaea sp.]
MSDKKFDRVFVIGAYLPNGGTVMAYHIGRIMQLDFGIPAIAVTLSDENATSGTQNYDVHMPTVSVAEMERQITPRDILIVNPSFSPHQFGWRLPGTKISYVQDFKTFALLDLKFDHYVSVSDFVRDFLRNVYALDTPVIPPFINLDAMPAIPAWLTRPANIVLPYRKGIPEVWDVSFAKIRQLLAERAPHIELAEPLSSHGVAQRDLFSRIASFRYLLTLSAAEGFGLVPLEAMALGTAVVGYDGFGGRHYMRNGDNCAVASYPNIERVAELLIDAVQSPERSAAMAERGRMTATHYAYGAFRQAWKNYLSDVLKIAPIG